MALIYCLVDPRDGAIRYIGQTYNEARRRKEYGGYRRAGGGHVWNWLRSVKDGGLQPTFVPVEYIDDATDDILDDAEIGWHSLFAEHGYDLTNDIRALGRSNGKRRGAAIKAAKSGSGWDKTTKNYARGERNPRTGKPGTMLGKTLSLTALVKIRKRVRCVEDGLTFSHGQTAGEFYGIHPASVKWSARHRRRTKTENGQWIHFEYVEDGAE